MALAGTFSVKDQYLFFYSSCQHWKFLPTWMANKCIFTIVKTSNDIIEHFFLFPSGLLSFLHKISIQLIGRIGGQLKTELTRIIYVSPPLKWNLFKVFCWWWIHFCQPILYPNLKKILNFYQKIHFWWLWRNWD